MRPTLAAEDLHITARIDAVCTAAFAALSPTRVHHAWRARLAATVHGRLPHAVYATQTRLEAGAAVTATAVGDAARDTASIVGAVKVGAIVVAVPTVAVAAASTTTP